MGWPAFVNWHLSTPIDDFEPGTSPFADTLNSYGVEGDLHIVTLQMWLPAGGTPVLHLGRTGFIDETSNWTALPELRNGAAYMRSWYRFATADMIADGAVSYELSGYTPATEGGSLLLNVFHHAAAPVVVYQEAADGSLNATPAEPADVPLLHHYFGRSAYDTTAPTNPPIIQPFGRLGIPPGFYYDDTGGITMVLEDGRIPGPTSTYTDQYGSGFFYPRPADLPTAGGAYDGHITWDTDTATLNPFSGAYNDPLGAQTAVIQGIQVGPAPPQNFMAVL